GGPALTLAGAPFGRGGTWNQDGTILFAPFQNAALQRVAAAGGTPVPATKLGPGDNSHRLPWFLPDGRHFLYAVTKTPNTYHTTIHLRGLASGEDKIVTEAAPR